MLLALLVGLVVLILVGWLFRSAARTTDRATAAVNKAAEKLRDVAEDDAAWKRREAELGEKADRVRAWSERAANLGKRKL